MSASTSEATPGPRWRVRWRLFRFALTLVLCAWGYEIGRWYTREADREAHLHTWRIRIARRLLAALGVQPSVPAGLAAKSDRARLIVANHRCGLDIGVLLQQTAGVFLSRADLGEWPVVGRLAKRAKTIFVDRESRHSGASAIREIRRRLQAGETVIVFPEGSTFRGDEVRTFRAGAFAAARGLDVDIVPVGLAYPPGVEYVDMSFVEHVATVAGRRRTPVTVVFGEPLTNEGRKTAEVAATCQTRVQGLVGEARAHFDEALALAAE